jgi:hypothetical protein
LNVQPHRRDFDFAQQAEGFRRQLPADCSFLNLRIRKRSGQGISRNYLIQIDQGFSLMDTGMNVALDLIKVLKQKS